MRLIDEIDSADSIVAEQQLFPGLFYVTAKWAKALV
jgi:hypothetical protein